MSPISMPFGGSGEFVPVREWTCPEHEYPYFHECDCEFCEGRVCETCETAEWRDTGETRELFLVEAWMWRELEQSIRELSRPSVISGRVVEWKEDLSIPRIVTPKAQPEAPTSPEPEKGSSQEASQK